MQKNCELNGYIKADSESSLMHKAFQDTVFHKSLKYEIHEICTPQKMYCFIHGGEKRMDPSTVEIQNQYL